VEDVVTEDVVTEIRVACEHGHVPGMFFASSTPGVWVISGPGATRVTYPDGVERWHRNMRCDKCRPRLNVPVVKPDTYSPILNQLAKSDSPVIRRIGPNAIEVPLKLMADAFGRATQAP
jgi:hypothetical protein